MNCSLFNAAHQQTVIALFTQVFADSEGEQEGQVIGELVANLIATTAPQDLIGCIASEHDRIVAGIFFSRFMVPTGQAAFLLSPVAVSTGLQGQGVGQQLINYGLDQLRSRDVELVFTYGAPAYYAKTGFKQITEEVVKAPFVLSQPIGWLAQSLDGHDVPVMQGDTRCVAALSDQNYW